MPQRCKLCGHPEREEIDRAILTAQASNRRIATQAGVSEAAVRRHTRHIPAELAQAAQAKKLASAEDLLLRLEGYLEEAEAFLAEAKAMRNPQVGLKAIAEARKTCEVLLEVAGELDHRSGRVEITLSPEWAALKARILEALRPYPEARKALAEALAE